MISRRFLGGIVASVLGVRPTTTALGAPMAVYHLADLDKIGFVLGNIHNHYAGTSGEATLALVVHGPALGGFRREAGIQISDPLAALVEQGLVPEACAYSMRAQGLVLKDLLPGFAVTEKGGVVRLAELQAAGYAYLRP